MEGKRDRGEEGRERNREWTGPWLEGEQGLGTQRPPEAEPWEELCTPA